MIGDTVGKCPGCGLNIVETEDGFVCESYLGTIPEKEVTGPHPYLYKDALARYGGCDLDATDAKALLAGREIRVQLRSKKTGNYYYKYARWNPGKMRVEILWKENAY